ncbi:MAG: hypothetical protein RL651_1464 [Pseudomonadota bacterium]|jgi:hypothetical protein
MGNNFPCITLVFRFSQNSANPYSGPLCVPARGACSPCRASPLRGGKADTSPQFSPRYASSIIASTSDILAFARMSLPCGLCALPPPIGSPRCRSSGDARRLTVPARSFFCALRLLKNRRGPGTLSRKPRSLVWRLLVSCSFASGGLAGGHSP